MPMSPTLSCANTYSLRFTVLYHQRHRQPLARAQDQERDEADAHTVVAAHDAVARRPIDPERLHLGAYALGKGPRRRTCGEAQTYFVGGMPMAEVAAVRAVDADHVDAQIGHVVAQALAHDFAGQARALHGLRAGV